MRVTNLRREASVAVSLENLSDGVDVGGRPDVKPQIHPDNDDNFHDNDGDDDDELPVCLSPKL